METEENVDAKGFSHLALILEVRDLTGLGYFLSNLVKTAYLDDKKVLHIL